MKTTNIYNGGIPKGAKKNLMGEWISGQQLVIKQVKIVGANLLPSPKPNLRFGQASADNLVFAF